MYEIRLIVFLGVFLSPLTWLNGQDQISEKEILAEQLFIQAESNRILEKPEVALETYNEIRKKDPRNIAVLYGTARCYWDLKEYDQSERTIDDALRFEPDNPWLLDFQLKILEERKKFKEAVTVAEKLFEITGDPLFIDQKAFYLASTGQYAASFLELLRLESIVGTTRDIILTKMDLLKSQNKTAEAVEVAKQGLLTFKNDTELMHEIAMMYVNRGDIKQSLIWYEKILEFDRHDARANIIVTKAKAGSSGNENMLSLISVVENPAISIDLKIAEILPLLNKLMNEKTNLLIRDLDSLSAILVSVHPKDPKAFSMRGDILYHSGKISQAISAYKKTIDLTPANFQIWRQLMKAQLYTADCLKLLDTAEEALTYYPNQALVFYYYAKALYHLERSKEALNIINEGLFMTGSDRALKADLLLLKGKIQYVLFQNEQADQTFNEAMDLNPSATEIQSAYAVFLVKSGLELDKNTLAFLMKEAQNSPLVALDLSEILIQKKDMRKAESVLSTAVETFKFVYPKIVEKYGDFKNIQNQREEAVRLWKEALILMPDNTTLKTKIKV